jgi:hypothetical protein
VGAAGVRSGTILTHERFTDFQMLVDLPSNTGSAINRFFREVESLKIIIRRSNSIPLNIRWKNFNASDAGVV